MALQINTNINSMNAHRSLSLNDMRLSKSLEKLSSGLRINRASDDAAGLSISETLRGQIRGLAQAERNSQDGISLINTAEGAMNEIHSILQRMRELAVQSSNGTLTDTDRIAVDAESQALALEIDNIANNTTFNNKALTNTVGNITFQVGANAGQETIAATVDVTAATLTVDALSINLLTQGAASTAITDIDAAIEAVSTGRTALGAVANRLEHTINNVATSRENLAASESRIREVDMADEMSNLTRQQILVQSATAMLAQANSQPQSVLSLFR